MAERYLTPIPYDLWKPELEKFGFGGFDRLPQGDSFDKLTYSDSGFQMKSAIVEEGGPYVDCHERTFSIALGPEGKLGFEGYFFRDGGMVATEVRVDLLKEAGARVPEYGAMHAAALALSERRGLRYVVSGWAFKDLKNQGDGNGHCDDLSEIVNVLGKARNFHGQWHALYKDIGRDLADRAEKLFEDQSRGSVDKIQENVLER